MSPGTAASAADVRSAIDSVPLWYHTLGFAPGVVTPGWFDLGPVLDKIPFPDVRGKRVLDVGTYDGFLAFELERRGAAEVVATDITDHEEWDWPRHLRAKGAEHLRQIAGEQKGKGFEVARDVLGSSVRRELISVYEISPERLGEFDVVVQGSLLLHLRDPIRALEAVRTVCRDRFVSIEEVDLRLSVLSRGRARARFDGLSDLLQWFVPNTAAHERMVRVAGFEVERSSGRYAEPYGPGHTPRGRAPRERLHSMVRRAFAGNDGVPHHAVLARAA